ncbi:hypothetical protein F2Q69_00032365 [Brassica cretica]|uniref:Cyclin n=1 Tax=Brassica cretica TaxID=69181 RepID=A0A8S9RW90_BRACR|nr:hypothetical protein F2Q69_00032365 [Brassica cretica]
MVARTPQKQRKVAMVVAPPLNSELLRETINKVDKCMERLQELQYTIAGGTKVVSGVNLSPRSTRTYLKTSLRCKQETLRIKNANNKKSPIGKFPASSPGDWRKMSLPAMLLGETVNEILQASQVTRDIVDALAPKKHRKSRRSIMPEEDEDGPKTPETHQKSKEQNHETVSSNIKARRKKEKQNKRSEPTSPRARSRIVFKIVSPHKTAEKVQVKANRVSPKHKPWGKKAVLFPNPLFISGSSMQQAKFSRTMSPVIASSKDTKKETPHKYAHCSHACFVAAFAYILRYLERPVDTSMTRRLTSLNVHRLLITSLLVAAKFLDRKCYNNAYYAKIGGVSTEEMNRLEKTFLFDLDFRLNITTEMFEKHCLMLQREAVPYDSSKLISVLGEVKEGESSVLKGWREGLIPFEKKKLGVKEEVYDKYSYLFQSAIDYEVCLRADVFVGNSFSTFSSLIVLERTQKARRLGFVSTCEDGGNVWRSYAYNLAGESEGVPRRRMTNMTHSSLQAISYGSNSVSCSFLFFVQNSVSCSSE